MDDQLQSKLHEAEESHQMFRILDKLYPRSKKSSLKEIV